MRLRIFDPMRGEHRAATRGDFAGLPPVTPIGLRGAANDIELFDPETGLWQPAISSDFSGGGNNGVSVMLFARPGETPAAHGTAILERALASSAADLLVPAGAELVVNAPSSTQVRLIGKTLRGPGTIRFTSGNLRVGSGATVSGQLKIRGTNKTNMGSGISVLSGSSDVTISHVDIRDTHHNGVNINGGTSNVRVLDNVIRNTGGSGADMTYQGCGVYASGQSSAINGLVVAGNEISETYGLGAVMLQTVSDLDVSRNRIARTFYRGVYLTGGNTGSVRFNRIRECGAINTTMSGVGCNGIMVNLTALASDVVVEENWIYKVAENGIEGRGTFVGNTIILTGAYPGLPTPSTEGMYITPESAAVRNSIFQAGGHGIYCFVEVSKSGLRILDNDIIDPKLSGVRVLAKVATLSDGLVGRNSIWGANDSTKYGVEMTLDSEEPGAFSGVRAVANEVFGRASNPLHASLAARGNSWQ